MDHCEISRWQLLKQKLNNLSFEDFLLKKAVMQDAICIDARTPEEYHTGHLKGAININYLSKDLVDQLEKLDPSKSYFVYCRTSRRSLRICVLLQNLGFSSIYHLEEGIKDHDV